jgi:3-methyl-2-oxobutanoate hydroxymethyltransferase
MTTRPRKPAPATPAPGKLPLPELVEMKRRREPIVMVTAYDAPGGRLADAAGVDIVLVGDSAAMTVLGHDSTVPATMDEMVFLTRAVTRGARRPLVVADMPFGSFQVSDETALENAIRFVKEAGADAVKLEGAGQSVSRVRALVGAGIPVMGHVGLTPQSATMLGGFKAQGRTAARARRLLEDAIELERAGCFSVVLEAVPTPVAATITQALEVPTIGIGAGPHCDGQVLVYHDLLGLYEGRAPRFVKRYADVAGEIRRALEQFAADVRSGAFPEEQHTYSIPDDELQEFQAGVLDSQRVDRSVRTDARAKPARPDVGTASGASGDQSEKRPDRTDDEAAERTGGDGAVPAPAVHDTHADH